MYKLTNSTQIIRLVDSASIPNDPANTDYAQYFQWLSEGNTPEPADVPSVASIQEQIVTSVQLRLDTFARTRNYDSILSACTYATSQVPKFASEGQQCVDLRDATWSTLYSLLAEVQAGTKVMPSDYLEVEPLLPVLQWGT